MGTDIVGQFSIYRWRPSDGLTAVLNRWNINGVSLQIQQAKFSMACSSPGWILCSFRCSVPQVGSRFYGLQNTLNSECRHPWTYPDFPSPCFSQAVPRFVGNTLCRKIFSRCFSSNNGVCPNILFPYKSWSIQENHWMYVWQYLLPARHLLRCDFFIKNLQGLPSTTIQIEISLQS